MNLKLKFIGVDDNDVIATSGALCAYEGTNAKFKYVGDGNDTHYLFLDSESKYNTGDGEIAAEGGNPFMCGDWRPEGGVCPIKDINGNQITNSRPTNGNYYHFDLDNYTLYLCNDPSHAFGSFGK